MAEFFNSPTDQAHHVLDPSVKQKNSVITHFYIYSKNIQLSKNILYYNESCIISHTDTNIDIQYFPTEDELNLLDEVEELQVVQIIEEQGLKYIAGYTAYRFRNEFPYLGTPTELLVNPDNDWVNYISRGRIISPCKELFETAKIMERLFQEYHGDFISKEPLLFQKLASKIISIQDKNCLTIPKRVLLCLIRTRTYIRVRELNKKLKTDAYKKQKAKKMTKLSLIKK